MTPEDLKASNLLSCAPYEKNYLDSDPYFSKILSLTLSQLNQQKNEQTIQSEIDPSSLDLRQMILDLKEKYTSKWADKPFKNRNITRHLPWADNIMKISIPINFQTVTVLYLNLFSENLKYSTINVPDNTFRTKQELMNIVLKRNSELLESLISDEKKFDDVEGEENVGWFRSIKTISIIQNRVGDRARLVNDLNMGLRTEVVKEDILNNLTRFGLSEVFQIHRVDFFHGDLRYFNLYPLEEQ